MFKIYENGWQISGTIGKQWATLLQLKANVVYCLTNVTAATSNEKPTLQKRNVSAMWLDLKSSGRELPYRFESGLGYLFLRGFPDFGGMFGGLFLSCAT